jgi:hypothetical protein
MMLVPQPQFVAYSVDHVASAGITKFLLLSTSRFPAMFCPCGFLRFVLGCMDLEGNAIGQLFRWGTKSLSFLLPTAFAVGDEAPSSIGWGRG